MIQRFQLSPGQQCLSTHGGAGYAPGSYLTGKMPTGRNAVCGLCGEEFPAFMFHKDEIEYRSWWDRMWKTNPIQRRITYYPGMGIADLEYLGEDSRKAE